MDSPLVSIVLPVYNGARYLEQSVNSCIEQTYSNWELIIVDDCSTDDTPRIVDSLAEKCPRIHAFHNETNRKLPASLNIGFQHAQGQFLTWTSHDNLYRKHAIERMVSVLMENRDIHVVYAAFQIIDENSALRAKRPTAEPEELSRSNVVGACFLYRNEVHAALGGYDEDVFLAEDYDFWLRAFCKFRLHAIDEDLYLYRVHEASLTSERKEQIFDITMKVLEKNLPGMLPLLDRLHRGKAHMRLARYANNTQDFSLLRRHLAAGWIASPGYCLRRTSFDMLAKTILGETVLRLLRPVYGIFTQRHS